MAHPQALFHRAATSYARLGICPIAPGVPRCRRLVLVATNSGQPGVRNSSRECEGTRQVQPYEGTCTHLNLSISSSSNAGVWAAKIWMFPFDPTCSSLGLAHYHANASPPARRKTQRIIPSCSFCAAWPPPAPRPPRRQSEAGRGEAPGRVWGVERRRLRPAAPRATRPPCAAPLH